MTCAQNTAMALVTLALLDLTAARPAAAQLLGSDYAGTIYDVDAATGVTSHARSTGIDSLAGIALSPDGKTLYGLNTSRSTNPFATGLNSFYRIDVQTGAKTLVGATGLSSIYEGDLAFDPTSGVLYGSQDAPGAGDDLNIFTINTATGVATIVGTVAQNINFQTHDLSGMAFDGSGNLYMVDTDTAQLLRVDKSTATVIKALSLTDVDSGAIKRFGTVFGMAFNPANGQLYATDGNGATNGDFFLYTIDTETGKMTTIGPTATGGGIGLSGLTFGPQAAPEPSQTAALGVGCLALAGLALKARRRLSA